MASCSHIGHNQLAVIIYAKDPTVTIPITEPTTINIKTDNFDYGSEDEFLVGALQSNYLKEPIWFPEEK